jgi:hypothetical protein
MTDKARVEYKGFFKRPEFTRQEAAAFLWDSRRFKRNHGGSITVVREKDKVDYQLGWFGDVYHVIVWRGR